MESLMRFVEDFPESLFSFNVFVGFAVAIIIFIIELGFIRSFTKYDSKTAQAVSLGHVVKARRTNMWKDDMGGSSDAWWFATYTYKVEGKIYRYKHKSRRPCLLSMKLYYLDNPENAFSGREYDSSVSVLFCLLPIVAAIVVINLLGGI